MRRLRCSPPNSHLSQAAFGRSGRQAGDDRLGEVAKLHGEGEKEQLGLNMVVVGKHCTFLLIGV